MAISTARAPLTVHLSNPDGSMLPLCVWVLPGDTPVRIQSWWTDYDPCNVMCDPCIEAAMTTPGIVARLCGE